VGLSYLVYPFIVGIGVVFAAYLNQGFLKEKLICEQEKIRAMFNSITWGQYFYAIISLLIIYYAVIGFKFYKWEILAAIGIRKVDNATLNTVSLSGLKKYVSQENDGDYQPKQSMEIDISPLVQLFTDEVAAFLQEADESEITKEQIINSLQSICSKYPAIKNADCRNELILLVANEINIKYPNLFQQNDLVRIWN